MDGAEEISAPSERESVINSILTTSEETVLNDVSLTAGAKTFIIKAVSAVKALHTDNQQLSEVLKNQNVRFSQEIEEKTKRYEQGLANYKKEFEDALAKQKEEIRNLTNSVNSAKNNYSNLKAKVNQPNNNPPSVKKPRIVQPLVTSFINKNKFDVLDNNTVEDLPGDSEDADAEEEEEEEALDYNSDPEFLDQRKLIREKARKVQKRKRANSDEGPSEAKNLGSKKTNKDNTLDKDKQDREEEKPKEIAPPPIKVIGIPEFKEIQAILLACADKNSFKIKSFKNNVWSINACNGDTYRKILQKVKDSELQYYTFEDKNTRDFRVMAKGLHPSTPIDDIIEDVSSKGLKIKSAVNILIKKTKIINVKNTDKNKKVPEASDTLGSNDISVDNTVKDSAEPVASNKKTEVEVVKLPLHQLSFEHGEDPDKIYAIKGICNMVVKIEPIKKDTRRILQCKRCQAFNHSANQCGKKWRCCKCAGQHKTMDCPFDKRIINPKCVNCGKTGHPASYRGCDFAKLMQQERDKELSEKKNKIFGNKKIPVKKNIFNEKTQVSPSIINQTTSGSYANAVKGNSNSSNDLIATLLATINAQQEQLKILTEKLSSFEKLAVKLTKNKSPKRK